MMVSKMVIATFFGTPKVLGVHGELDRPSCWSPSAMLGSHGYDENHGGLEDCTPLGCSKDTS